MHPSKKIYLRKVHVSLLSSPLNELTRCADSLNMTYALQLRIDVWKYALNIGFSSLKHYLRRVMLKEENKPTYIYSSFRT